MERIPLNFAILKEPVNWVILFLMVAIAGLAISVITQKAAPAA